LPIPMALIRSTRNGKLTCGTSRTNSAVHPLDV
jgi:hypothetical protein